MKKDESFLGKLGGTLARKKKAKEVSDLQEEGRHAINSPMSPASADVHPEDTLLGTVGSAHPCRDTAELPRLEHQGDGLVTRHHVRWHPRVWALSSRSRLEKSVGKKTRSSFRRTRSAR